MDNKKLMERNIPGMNRNARFAEVEHAENLGSTLKRILTYFAREKGMILSMLVIVPPACKVRPLISLQTVRKVSLRVH